MTIAVTYENGLVFQHFGHTEQFKIYETDGASILSQRILSSDGQGHGALAVLLSGNKVDALICGGIGAGAQAALKDAGIRLYAGVQGNCDEAVRKLLDGTLVYSESANCSHHHEEGHECHHHSEGGSCHCHH